MGDRPGNLRTPGTFNHKGVKIQTKLLELNDVRYEPSDFEQWLLSDSSYDNGEIPNIFTGSSFSLTANAEPPSEKLAQLSEIDPLFLRSWKHEREDLQDQSASGYDLSLATRALLAGWAGQEIVNLLIAHRRKHHADLKLRQDYYERTLNVAAKCKAVEVRDEMIGRVKKSEELPLDVSTDAAEMFAIISGVMGVRITKLVRYLSDPNIYEMCINGRTVPIGTIENLTSQHKFRNKIADVALLPKEQPKAIWERLLNHMLTHLEEVEVSVEAMERGSMEGWLQQYLSNSHTYEEEKLNEAVLMDRPLRLNGKIWFTISGLRSYIFNYCHERITSKWLAVSLRKIGCKNEKWHIQVRNQERTTRDVWTRAG